MFVARARQFGHHLKRTRETITSTVLLPNLRAVLLGKIEIAERAVKIHARSQHVGVGDEYFLALRTGDFYGLTHDSSIYVLVVRVRAR